MESERRDVLKTIGVAASGFALAGCLGSGSGSDDTTNDSGDETVTPGDPGWFDIDSNIFEERMGREIAVTESSLFRTADDFGIRFTVANQRGAPLTSLTVHVDLLGEDNGFVDGYEASYPERESTDDLAPNETWSSDIVFENTDPNLFLNDIVGYRIWATAEAEGSAPGNASADNGTSENGTMNESTLNNRTAGGSMNSTTTGNPTSNSTESMEET